MRGERYDRNELARFRDLQKKAYDAVEEVGAGLREGITERGAADRVRLALRARGVGEFFHVPFAWFGDRTCFKGFRTPFDFFPTQRRLARGDAVILDVAPIVDGFSADIGYATSFGPNEDVARAKRHLEIFRSHIVERVRAGATMQAIYREVDDIIADFGGRNCHHVYPFHTLGHKVGRMPFRRIRPPSIGGFDPRTLLFLYRQMAEARFPILHRETPIWSGDRRCGVPPEPGLWAVEPHIGLGDVGVKWEEILVITPGDAYWLDDDLPHVRGWREAREAEAALLTGAVSGIGAVHRSSQAQSS